MAALVKFTPPRPGKRWYNDPVVLFRLRKHEQLKREGLSPQDVALELTQSYPQWLQDEKRVIALMQRAATLEIGQLREEADHKLREIWEDADRLTAETNDGHAKAMHQANKKSAVDTFMKLHGLAKPTEIKVTNDTVIRKYIGVELRQYDTPSQLAEPVQEVIDAEALDVQAAVAEIRDADQGRNTD